MIAVGAYILLKVYILVQLLIFASGTLPKVPVPTAPISLPQDDAFQAKTEVQWWYWTGHLTEPTSGREFGYEVCFFVVTGTTNLVQVAITDVTKNSFTYDEKLEVFKDDGLNGTFSLQLGNSAEKNVVKAIGGNGQDSLYSQVGRGKYILDIQLSSSKPPLLHYNGLAHPYIFGGWTYYYSRTKMATKGTLTIDGVAYKVTGNSWFDRQWGDLGEAVLQGWQWFAIELNDNTQIMLFDFRGDDSEKYGHISNADGSDTVLNAQQFSVVVESNWTSPTTQCTYPSKWSVSFQKDNKMQTYTVIPVVTDQELVVKESPTYWEGKTSVLATDGSLAGEAYVELNGYCSKVQG